MGLYYRTLEMSRHRRFACFRCGPEVPAMVERRLKDTQLELRCATCGIIVRLVTRQPIPRRPDDLRGVIRYKRDDRPLDHGAGLRCHNCALLLVPVGKGDDGGQHDCRRCHTQHFLTLGAPAASPPRVLRSASTASSSPAAMPASCAPSG